LPRHVRRLTVTLPSPNRSWAARMHSDCRAAVRRARDPLGTAPGCNFRLRRLLRPRDQFARPYRRGYQLRCPAETSLPLSFKPRRVRSAESGYPRAAVDNPVRRPEPSRAPKGSAIPLAARPALPLLESRLGVPVMCSRAVRHSLPPSEFPRWASRTSTVHRDYSATKMMAEIPIDPWLSLCTIGVTAERNRTTDIPTNSRATTARHGRSVRPTPMGARILAKRATAGLDARRNWLGDRVIRSERRVRVKPCGRQR